VDQRYCTDDGCYPTEERCTQNYNIVGIFSLIYLAIIVVICCVLSYQSRKLPNCFSEAKYIMFAMYNIALIAVLIGMVAALGGDDLTISAKTLLLTFAIVYTATGSVLLVFTPKFTKIWSSSEEQIRLDLRTAARYVSQARSSISEGRSSFVYSGDAARYGANGASNSFAVVHFASPVQDTGSTHSSSINGDHSSVGPKINMGVGPNVCDAVLSGNIGARDGIGVSVTSAGGAPAVDKPVIDASVEHGVGDAVVLGGEEVGPGAGEDAARCP
jgi:hypothetical protein